MVGIQFQFIGRIIHSIYGEKPIFSTKDRQNSTLEPRAAKIDGRNKIFLLLLIFAAMVPRGAGSLPSKRSSNFLLKPQLEINLFMLSFPNFEVLAYQEKGDNRDEFPDDFFRGTGSGIWLSFITMTTAG